MHDQLLINAHNVHSGGALVLLKKFINSTSLNKYSKIILVIDDRCNLEESLPEKVFIRRIRPNIISRFLNEMSMSRFSGPIFSFGNLPPLFAKSQNIFVFLHNSLYFEQHLIKLFPIKTRLRINFEVLLFKMTCRSVFRFLVQTPHMKCKLEKLSVNPRKILVAPFADLTGYHKKTKSNNTFIYVSSGDAHKNLRNLINAWMLLSDEGIFPKLYLTISDKVYPDVTKWIDELTLRNKLNIINLGVITSLEIDQIYQAGSALIFPSFTESLGLPLIEAHQCGVPILAPELDYVRDIVCPDQTFDPRSSISIARAVKRHLKLDSRLTSIISVDDLVNDLFGP